MVPDLRIEDQGRIRGLGHERVARVDVAVVVALAPLPVRGQEVESVVVFVALFSCPLTAWKLSVST